MRLRLTFGLCALLLALALAACGGGGEEKATPSGGQQQATPAATKTTEAAETPAAGEKPSNGGEVSLKDIPVYPGADKVADYSGTSPIPLPGGEGPNAGEYSNVQWALYETGDSVDKVAKFYKDKMPDNGWHEEGWFDTSGEGGGVALGSYTRDDGKTAAWVFTSGNEKTEIIIGTGSR